MYRFAQPDLIPPGGKHKGWLLTNGIGGFAASTISGINTRRYHGLLVASLRPPVDRRMLLAKLEEEIYVDGSRYKLFSSENLGGYSGQGFNYLQEFKRFPLPTYIYQVEDVRLEKEIMLVAGHNTVLVRYRVTNETGRNVRLRIYPLTTCRDYHWTTRKNEWPFVTRPNEYGAVVEAYEGAPLLYLASDKASCAVDGYWHFNNYYEEEAFRGLDSVEDLYCPVVFELETSCTLDFWIAASTNPVPMGNDWATKKREQEIGRIRKVIEQANFPGAEMDVLALAADNFLVERRNVEGMSVIAGYPWFSDWGRDAMISLPGLTLATKRVADFKNVMRTFARYEKDGLIPNLFPDDAGDPAYNTVDASLWTFWCIYKYVQYTGDYEFPEEIYPVLNRIIDKYMQGTMFGIGMDRDGLIVQGEEDKALTWMDAKVENQVITPRRGKAVEINALWNFALCFTAFLASKLGNETRRQELSDLRKLVIKSFNKEFWHDDGGYLYDVVDGRTKDAAIRCNQIIALSLPAQLLDRDKELSVLQTVWKHLYTGYGLRTLAADSSGYCGHYSGNQRERDRAYHQGTVWVWPWGHFVSSVNRIYGRNDNSRRIVRGMVSPMLAHLHDQALGTVAEIFEGDNPHYPRGCFAQAWSVAELIRVVYEDILGNVEEISLESGV
ncbi:MAG: amylo-alpha-1,6-glucosidase [Ignavibacteriales bacterium]